MSSFVNRYTEFFSAFPSYAGLSGGTNIYNLGGTRASNSGYSNTLETVNPDIRSYTQYLASVARLAEYRNADIVQTVLNLFRDSVLGTLNFEVTDVVTIIGDDKWTKRINEILHQLDLETLIKNAFDDMVYAGSYGYYLEKTDQKFVTKDLLNPCTLGYLKSRDSYVLKGSSQIATLNSAIFFSSRDLKVVVDDNVLSALGEDVTHNFDQSNELFEQESITLGKPLFLNVELKLKDYVLKDLISAFLSLIILIEKDTFLIDGQRSTDMDSLLKLCDRVKDMIVTRDDMDLLASAKLNKEALIRRLFDRVRVIPSIANALSGMQQWNTTNLQEKLSSLQTQKSEVRDDLLTSIGFPLDLFSGSTNKWEVERQNDRYNLRLIAYRNSVRESCYQLVELILKELGHKCSRSHIRFNCFELTTYELNNKLQAINNHKDLLAGIQDLVRTSQEFSENSNIKNPNVINTLIEKLIQDSGVKLELGLKQKQSEEYNV